VRTIDKPMLVSFEDGEGFRNKEVCKGVNIFVRFGIHMKRLLLLLLLLSVFAKAQINRNVSNKLQKPDSLIREDRRRLTTHFAGEDLDTFFKKLDNKS